jgi:hypothetical protein
MKKILITTAAASAMLVAAPASAFDFKISGQVNQAAIIGGDAKGDDISVVDNNMSGSRFRFTASKESEGLTYGFRYELQFQANKSSDAGASGSQGTASEVRWAQAYVSGGFGKIAMGKSEGAASDVADVNFGNGNFYSTPQLIWLAYRGTYRDAIGDESAGLFVPFDAAGRSNNIQYHTPKFGGASFAIGLDNGDQKEFAVRYAGKSFKARLGVRDTPDNTITAGSAMYKAGGLALGVSFGKDDNNSDADYTGLHAAYTMGKLTVGIESAEQNDGPEGVLSFGATYRAAKGFSIYANRADFDLANGGSADGLMVGMHAKF